MIVWSQWIELSKFNSEKILQLSTLSNKNLYLKYNQSTSYIRAKHCTQSAEVAEAGLLRLVYEIRPPPPRDARSGAAERKSARSLARRNTAALDP